MAGVLLTHDPATAGELAEWVGITAGGAEYRLAFPVELLGTAAGLNRDATRRVRQHRGG